jgi:hypothetical protein
LKLKKSARRDQDISEIVIVTRHQLHHLEPAWSSLAITTTNDEQ